MHLHLFRTENFSIFSTIVLDRFSNAKNRVHARNHCLNNISICKASSLPSAPSPSGQCEDTTRYLEKELNLCCTLCKPGMRLKVKCSSTSDTVCEPCPHGSYIEQMNYFPRCFRCSQCKIDRGLQYLQKCNSSTPSTCMCQEGMFCIFRGPSSDCKECKPFTRCPPGHGVSRTGMENSDVKCSPCPEGTFSEKSSYTEKCQRHTDCESQGRSVLSPGDATSDAKCGAVVRPTLTSDPRTTSTTQTVSTGSTGRSTVSSTVGSIVSSTGFLVPRVRGTEPQDRKWIMVCGVSVAAAAVVLLSVAWMLSRKRALGRAASQSPACKKKALDLQDGRPAGIGSRLLERTRPGGSVAGQALSPCQEDSLWGLLLPREKDPKERHVSASEGQKAAR
ncbi:tumor necrosis factor receptor superfamily member 1B-like isoform X1 [Scleropages formosus]|uniref:Tumor necrosis factor receptor superfamily member 1B-like n=1 Tax=Scleropages formosus TaxID=113540 RepID=A0A8C9RJN4_SCLFO|nr:tumor necrosis factor receptor superfamily member 1B-like isoform X1 [Scleropages formosus]